MDPSPDDPVEKPDPTLDCLNLGGGAQVDASLQCKTPVLCGLDSAVDGGCGCRQVAATAAPAAMCGARMRCLDGKQVVERDGRCECEQEPFVDDTSGVGPRPSPPARIGW